MAEFSSEKAIVSGFQVIRRTPLALAVWGLLYLVFGFAPSMLLYARVWPQLSEAMAQKPPDPAAVQAAMSGATNWAPLLWPVSLTLMAVLYGAVYRAVLTPADRGFFFLRLTARELWLALTTVALLVVFGLGFAVLIVAIALLSQAVPGIVTFLAIVGSAVLLIWLVLRFSLAGPMAWFEKRFVFADAWPVTAGQGLKLFGVALALVVIVILMEMVLILPIVFAAMFSGGMQELSVNPGHALGVLAPWLVVGSLLLGLLGALIYAVVGAPWASIYQQLTGQGEPAA